MTRFMEFTTAEEQPLPKWEEEEEDATLELNRLQEVCQNTGGILSLCNTDLYT